MTLDQLKVFCTIIETGSFSAAAEKLYRVQSAVSSAIKKLEESLSVELFNREGYRPELTEAGKEIHRQALNILKQTEFMDYTAAQLAVGEEAELAIAIDGVCPLEKITPVLKQFNQSHPHVRLQLSIEYLGAVERLNQKNIDLAFTQIFEWPEWIESINVFDIQYIPVASPDHPLARDLKSGLENIEQHTQIVVSSTQSTSISVNVNQNAMIWGVSDFASKKQLIKDGFGWGYIPLHIVEEELAQAELVNLATNVTKKSRGHHFKTDIQTIYLARRKDQPRGPMAGKLWSLIEESFNTTS